MTNTIASAAPVGAAARRVSDPYPVQVAYLGDSQEYRGKNISLDVLEGTRLTLTVPENSGSSGYRWSVVIDDESAPYLEVSKDETLRPRCGTPPTGGAQRRFTIEVADGAPTPLKLRLELARPWGETVPPSVVKQVALNVEENHDVVAFSPDQRQGILPGGCVMPRPPAMQNAERVRETYGDLIAALPGVTGLGVTRDGSLVIRTESGAASTRLDTLLEDSIETTPVAFKVTGRIKAQAGKAGAEPAEFHLADPGDVLRKYGRDIQGLPGVTRVGVEAVRLGPMLPAQQDMLVVRAASPEAARLLDNLLEDEIEGVPVRINATVPRPIFRPLDT